MKIKPPHILLADSDLSSSRQFQELFGRLGWPFSVADSGAALLEEVGKQQFDVIIADVAMPPIEGASVLSEILKTRPGQAIIAVGNETPLDDALTLLRSGATDIVERPVDSSWLERWIRLKVQSARDEARERDIYRFRVKHESIFVMTSRELAAHGLLTLPIVSHLQDCGILDAQAALRLKVGIQEVVVNALEHGNLELQSEWKEEICSSGVDKFSILRRERLQSDEYGSRTVTIKVKCDPGVLRITVRDCGEGFLNKVSVSSVATNEGIRCHGRGLALIASSADELMYEANGAEVTIVKYLPTDGHGTQI